MASKAVLKVPGGKLVKVELESSGGEIARAKITGDFFVHPEEALADLEQCLVGCRLDEKTIVAKLDKKIYEKNALLVGFTAQDVAKAIMAAACSPE